MEVDPSGARGQLDLAGAGELGQRFERLSSLARLEAVEPVGQLFDAVVHRMARTARR